MARRQWQNHVEWSQLPVVAASQIAESAPDTLMGVALGSAMVGHTKLLRPAPERQIAARDLRLRHEGDPQELADVLEVRHQVVVAPRDAELIVPVPDHRARRLEGQRMVD